MKASPETIQALTALLRERKTRAGLGIGQIARMSGVDASQVSRVLGGQFRTLSHNVVQICKALDADPESLSAPPRADEGRRKSQDAAALRLQDHLLAVWDRTPADADRLAAFLDQLAVLRYSGRRGGKL